MSGPFFELGAFGPNASLAIAVALGAAFGFFLERGGMGDARKLSAQFYGTDLAVFELMFTALVTAMLGVHWLSWLGWLEPALVYVPPTFVVPQLLGGAVFGVGFVMAGLCPGTSCVGISSGSKDAIATLAGLLVGIFVFAEAMPWVGPLYRSTPAGTLTLSEWTGLSRGWTVASVTLLALIGFAAAGWWRRREEGATAP